MESTQNKIYEIEESAIIGQNIKSNIEDDFNEEAKTGNQKYSHLWFIGDFDLYADQFDEKGAKEGS